MNDAIAYMAWERVVPWKILSMTARPDRPLVPLGFGARNRDFLDLLETGSRIWVVTRIVGEFSLAARVVVTDILDRNSIPERNWPVEAAGLFAKWRYVAVAHPGQSEFFETNNAGEILEAQQVRFAQNRTIAYRKASLEDAFSACVEQASETIFLSYRWAEGRRFAIALARELRNRGLSPWLDALSIPRYQARHGQQPGVDVSRLEKLIKMGIKQSSLAVVINTSSFATKSWTRVEMEHIRNSAVPWFQVMRGGDALECDEPPIVSRKPEEVASEIVRRIARS